MGLLLPDTEEEELLRRYAGNPVGSERMGQQMLANSEGVPFDPVVDPNVARWPGRPMTQSEYDRTKEGSLALFDQASMMAPGVAGPAAPAGPVVAAKARPGGAVPRPRARPPAVYEPPVNDGLPELPPRGHNMPPDLLPEGLLPPAAPRRAQAPMPPPPPQTAQLPGLLAGRLGSNADDQLSALGLPTYAEMVPSANKGPVTPEQLQAGAPKGDVFDLSSTWRAPGVAQADLARIDPSGGKRKGLPAHIQNVIGDPEMAAKLRGVAEAGLRAGGAYWYNAEPLREHFVSELGQEEGTKQFNRYMSIVGATSAGSDVGQNVRAASYYLTQERQGTPVRTSADLISPYGHKMQQAHVSGYRGLDEGGTLNSETQPKRSSFVENLSGNQQPVTVDKHNLRLIGMLSQDPAFLNTTTAADVNYPKLGLKKGDSRNWRDEVANGNIPMDLAVEHPHMWKDVPEPAHYAALEKWQQGIAKDMGLTPAQFQAALWVGGGRATGLRSLPTSFMGTFENRLARTAQERGGTPKEALLDFIHGRSPLLTPALTAGLGGGALAGLLEPQDQSQ